MLRFCIVGAGFIGGVHAEALELIPGTEVSVVCSRDPARANALATRVGAVAATDYEEAVARHDVDVVSICTPSGTHAEIATAAALAGKHLVVEKPLDVTLERVDRIIRVARESGVKLTCVFPLRFMKGCALARQAVNAGRLGRLVLANAYIKWYRDQNYYDSSDWKGTLKLDGGGALINQGIHNVDLLNYLAGPVSRVVGRIDTLVHRMETEDTVAAVLAFTNGAMGTIEACTGSWPGDNGRVELHGDRGTIALENGRIVCWKLACATPEEEEKILDGEMGQGSGASGATDIGCELHRRQLQDMVEAVQENRDPAVPGFEGRDSVAIIRAVYRSSVSQRWEDVC